MTTVFDKIRDTFTVPTRHVTMSITASNGLKLIAIIAVLFIHTTARWEVSFMRNHGYFSEDFLAIFLNQVARFSVPFFVFISGFGLAVKYQADSKKGKPFSLKEFFSRRALKIGLPFLVLTLVILISQKKLGTNLSLPENIQVLFTYLFKRGADYHFYFFTIILECYALFPLLFRINSTWLLAGLFLLHVIFTAPSHIFFQKMGWYRPSFPASFIVYWVFYFYLGIYLSYNLVGFTAKLKKIHNYWVIIIFLLAFGLVMYEYIYWSNVYSSSTKAGPGYYNHFHRQTVLFYSLAFIILVFKYNDILDNLMQRRAFQFAAPFSFSIYIFHTWMLRLLHQTPLTHNAIALTITLFVLTLALR